MMQTSRLCVTSRMVTRPYGASRKARCATCSQLDGVERRHPRLPQQEEVPPLRHRRSAQDGVAERQHDVAREEADGARLLASHLEHRHAGQARRGAEVDACAVGRRGVAGGARWRRAGSSAEDAPRARVLRPDHEDEAVPSPEVGASHVGRGDVLDRVDPEAPLLSRRGLEEVRARPRARSHLEPEPGLRAAPLLGTERDGRAAQVRDAAVGRARVWTGVAPAELAFAARPELDPAKLKDGAHLVRLV
mmetsp:Transcript_26325/g.76486  ORF Transcript_26325/g.76486 Transcript_26325/m.76486 type:complete len:248 (+) Transcript_26325:927-1670(+)